MKRFVLPALWVLALLFLSGCGASAAKEAREELAHRLSVKPELSCCAQLRAEYEEYSCSFTLDYRRDADGASVEVLSPENIAGVKANVAPDGLSLEYDGLRLDLGQLSGTELSPMSALPALVEALQNGHLDSYWEEDGALALSLVLDDGLSVTVWLERASLTPLRAQLISAGRVAVFCEINEWSL